MALLGLKLLRSAKFKGPITERHAGKKGPIEGNLAVVVVEGSHHRGGAVSVCCVPALSHNAALKA